MCTALDTRDSLTFLQVAGRSWSPAIKLMCIQLAFPQSFVNTWTQNVAARFPVSESATHLLIFKHSEMGVTSLRNRMPSKHRHVTKLDTYVSTRICVVGDAWGVWRLVCRAVKINTSDPRISRVAMCSCAYHVACYQAYYCIGTAPFLPSADACYNY